MEWNLIISAPRHDRATYGSTNQPRIIAWDGVEVYEARHYDGDWYRGSEKVSPTHWVPMPDPPIAAPPTISR